MPLHFNAPPALCFPQCLCLRGSLLRAGVPWAHLLCCHPTCAQMLVPTSACIPLQPLPCSPATSSPPVGAKLVVQQAQDVLAALDGALEFYTAQGQGRIMAGLLHYASTLREQLQRIGAAPAPAVVPPPDVAQRHEAQRNMNNLRQLILQLTCQLASLPAALDAEAAQHKLEKETLLREMHRAKTRAEQADKVIKRQRCAHSVRLPSAPRVQIGSLSRVHLPAQLPVMPASTLVCSCSCLRCSAR